MYTNPIKYLHQTDYDNLLQYNLPTQYTEHPTSNIFASQLNNNILPAYAKKNLKPDWCIHFKLDVLYCLFPPSPISPL